MQESRLFELDATILERIIFAMEDQSRSKVIELRTGNLADRPAGPLSPQFADPPRWTPADGFALMEGFLDRLTDASLKRELKSVLSLGKGVFKGFRAVLARHPDAESRYRAYKNAALRYRIESWMDEMRESLGLERLGLEPEDFGDLHDEELSLRTTTLDQFPFDIRSFVDAAFEESLETIPAAPAELERRETLVFLGRKPPEIHVLHYDDTEGEPMAVAAAALEESAPDSGAPAIGIIRFIHVQSDFRALDLEIKLIAGMNELLRQKGATAVLLRCGFLRPSAAEGFAERGFLPAGTQYLIT